MLEDGEYRTIDQSICFYSRRKRWYFDEFVIIQQIYMWHDVFIYLLIEW